jgi:hypothetical protein
MKDKRGRLYLFNGYGKSKKWRFFISDWFRNRNSVEYFGIRENICNPDFNYGEFATIKYN